MYPRLVVHLKRCVKPDFPATQIFYPAGMAELDWRDEQVPEIAITRNSTVDDVAAQMQGVEDVIQFAQFELHEFQRLCAIADGMAFPPGGAIGRVGSVSRPLRRRLAATQELHLFRVKFEF